MRVEFDFDRSRLDSVEKAFRQLNPKQQKKVWRASINAAVKTFRAQNAKRVRERYTVKASSFKKAIKLKDQSAVDMSATISVSGSRFPVTDFTVKPALKNQRSVKQRMNDAVENARPNVSPRIKLLQQGAFRTIEGTFQGNMPSGMAVLRRKGDERSPTETIMGRAAAEMAGYGEVIEPSTAPTMDKLVKEINFRIDRIIKAGR